MYQTLTNYLSGKTYFLVYTLLRRMAAGEPVLFSTSAGSTLLLDRDGVRHIRTDELETPELCYRGFYKCASPVWSLIDSSVSGEAEDGVVTHPMFFVVCASPSRPSEYRHWRKKEYPSPFIMEPWSVRELGWLCVAHAG